MSEAANARASGAEPQAGGAAGRAQPAATAAEGKEAPAAAARPGVPFGNTRPGTLAIGDDG